jgi:hypothetical protein
METFKKKGGARIKILKRTAKLHCSDPKIVQTGPRGGKFIVTIKGEKIYCKSKKTTKKQRICSSKEEQEVINYPIGPKGGRYYLTKKKNKVYCRLRDDFERDFVSEKERELEAAEKELEAEIREFERERSLEQKDFDSKFSKDIEAQREFDTRSSQEWEPPRSHQSIPFQKRYRRTLVSRNNNCLPKGYEIESFDMVASGVYGKIFKICESKNKTCNFIVKQANYNPFSNERDVYFLSWFNQRLKIYRIVPKLYSSTFCYDSKLSRSPRYFSMVMDRWDGDILKTSLYKTSKLITEDHLLQMFFIAWTMHQFGVIHGDLKPDQFLYSKNKPYIVVTDFGAAGHVSKQQAEENGPAFEVAPVPYYFLPQLSWSADCFNSKHIIPLDSKHIYSKLGILPYLNFLQLDHYLKDSRQMILLPDDTMVPYKTIDESFVPEQILNDYKSTCMQPIIKQEEGYVVTREAVTKHIKPIFELLSKEENTN